MENSVTHTHTNTNTWEKGRECNRIEMTCNWRLLNHLYSRKWHNFGRVVVVVRNGIYKIWANNSRVFVCVYARNSLLHSIRLLFMVFCARIWSSGVCSMFTAIQKCPDSQIPCAVHVFRYFPINFMLHRKLSHFRLSFFSLLLLFVSLFVCLFVMGPFGMRERPRRPTLAIRSAAFAICWRNKVMNLSMWQ